MPVPGLFPPPLPCPVENTASALAADTRAALVAYAGAPMTLPEFYARAAVAQARVGCLREELSGAQVAELMEVLAIISFIQKDHNATVALLRAARQSAEGASLPEAVLSGVPDLKPLQSRANAASPPDAVLLPVHPSVKWEVNGTASLTAPRELPYLLQAVWEDGKVHWTGLIPTGGAPDLGTQLAIVPPAVHTCPTPDCPIMPPCPTPPPRPTPPQLWLTVSALGSTALAAGLYGWGVHTDNVFWSEDTPREELETLQDRSQALQWSALGVGIVGLSLDVGLGVKLAQPYKAQN